MRPIVGRENGRRSRADTAAFKSWIPNGRNRIRFTASGRGICSHERSTVAIGAHTAKNADRPGEPPRRERHHVHARWVEPLQVIDRHQQRPVVGEAFDDREERRGHGALIGGRRRCPPASVPGRPRIAGVRADLPTRMRAPRPADPPGPCRPARIRPPPHAPITPGNLCPVPAPRQPARGWFCRCRARPQSAMPMARKSQKPETPRSSGLL